MCPPTWSRFEGAPGRAEPLSGRELGLLKATEASTITLKLELKFAHIRGITLRTLIKHIYTSRARAWPTCSAPIPCNCQTVIVAGL